MARIATIVLSVAVTLVVPAILAVNCIRMVTNEQFVRGRLRLRRGSRTTATASARQTRERLALVGLARSSRRRRRASRLLREARLANGEAAFNARELAHMEDVRTAVSRAYRFQLIAVVAIGVLAVLFALLGSPCARSCPSRSREAPC